jgi:L-threonylcarbamoyladenylate synthase
MQTLRLPVDPDRLEEPQSQSALDQASAILRRGGTVALPTETVYGLGANALNPEAVAATFAAKQRPDWDPLIVHVSDAQMLNALVLEIPQPAQRLVERLIGAFWPGPLTLLLPRSPAVPDSVTAGRPLVGVRMPAHPVALELIRRAGMPIAAPSANSFGHTSPTTADHVLDDLDGRIDAVLDAGPTAFGLESTVLDPNVSPMIVYRPGAITLEQIRAIAGPVELFAESAALASKPPEALPSPGVGLRHYAPKARLILMAPDDNLSSPLISLETRLREQLLALPQEQVGIMLPTELACLNLSAPKGAATIFPWGNWSNPEELARRLFAGLRSLDSLGCTVILCPVPPARGIGVAIGDRLRKAASRHPARQDGETSH